MEYLSVFSPNAGKMQTRITPNMDTFHAVMIITISMIIKKENIAPASKKNKSE